MGSRKKDRNSSAESYGDMVFNINYANEEFLSAKDPLTKESSFTAADIYEDADHVFIDMEVPGIDPNNISITIKGNVLTVEGVKSENKTKEKISYHCAERDYGKFKRSFGLGGAVDSKYVSCSYRNGILHLTIPKLVDRRHPVHEVKIES
jgi:HSP20 family protein